MLTSCSPFTRVFPELTAFEDEARRSAALKRAYRDARAACRFRIWTVLALGVLLAAILLRLQRTPDPKLALAVIYGFSPLITATWWWCRRSVVRGALQRQLAEAQAAYHGHGVRN